jgi:hypothetical protein
MRRPLRSVMLGNPSYLSAYVLGVAQAMGQLGHWHRDVSVLDDIDRVSRQLEEMHPDVIWTHTVPWVPREAAAPGWVYLNLLADWRRRGARVLLHDGDPRSATRFPQDISASFDLALCNHRLPRLEWRTPVMRWPYAAMAQRELGAPVDALRCGLLFAGIVRKDESLYSPRTELLGVLREKLGDRLTIRTGGINDRMQCADVAASAQAVLGLGRPEVPGWVDTRVFQYPGAGGVLVHDDAAEFLVPGVHFVAFERAAAAYDTALSVLAAFEKVGHEEIEMRCRKPPRFRPCAGAPHVAPPRCAGARDVGGRMTTPIRSLMLGDCDHYKSPYMRGVAQAMDALGHRHAEVSLRLPLKTIEQRLRLWRPDIIWTHMLLWAPAGAPPVADLVQLVEEAAHRGARVLIHDGDAKAPTRYPYDLSSWCSLALVNHAYDRSAWRVPVMRWPYFAARQLDMAKPVESLRCELFFAGMAGGGLYAARSSFLDALRARGVKLRTPARGENTIDRTPEIAASAGAVLGFGRPGVPGWVDTRVFQYPGAGGILLHDDVQGYLEPWVHFVPYVSGSAESVVDALARLRAMPEAERLALRQRAFTYVQANDSSVPRVQQALQKLRQLGAA